MLKTEITKKLLEELQPGLSPEVLRQISPLCNELTGSNSIVCHGVGREGLMMRALAMRLYHLGCDVHVLGDMSAPPVNSGDILFVSAGPGHFATVEPLVNIARSNHAKVICITAEPDGLIPKIADMTITIPAQTMASDNPRSSKSILPMGSLFEVLMLLFFEILVLELQEKLKVSNVSMRAKHTNLE